VTVVEDPEQVSYLPSVGTTLHKTATDGGTTLDGDDEKSDFLSEKQDLMRIPSKIAFKPMKGRSFALEVRQSDLDVVREGNISDVMNAAAEESEQRDQAEAEEVAPPRKETRKQRRQRRKEMKQKAKKTETITTTTTIIKKKDMNPAEIIVQSEDGLEILATQQNVIDAEPPTKKPRRWNLRQRLRGRK
jgi:hypothetical protein